jgi:signal transduction histidine kinase
LLREFTPLADARRAKLELDAEPSIYALLHAESFRQVMLNLLDNAIKYGPAGQTVRIAARSVDSKVRIAVEDEGPGIKPRERHSIWEPFVRGGDALETTAAGSGIGLSVVREITEWHGGHAHVEPGTGGGARFVIEIPMASLAQAD